MRLKSCLIPALFLICANTAFSDFSPRQLESNLLVAASDNDSSAKQTRRHAHRNDDDSSESSRDVLFGLGPSYSLFNSTSGVGVMMDLWLRLSPSFLMGT